MGVVGDDRKLQGQRNIMEKIQVSTHTTVRQGAAFMKSQLQGKCCVCQEDNLMQRILNPTTWV